MKVCLVIVDPRTRPCWSGGISLTAEDRHGAQRPSGNSPELPSGANVARIDSKGRFSSRASIGSCTRVAHRAWAYRPPIYL